MSVPIVSSDRLQGIRKRHGRRMAKYFAGSVIAFVVSTVTFSAAFASGLLGSKGASLAASATGAIANYFLNRNWAWGKRGRADFRREVIPYWRTVIVTAVAAAIVTGAANAVMRDAHTSRGVRTLGNTVAFVATYGIAFLFKYRMFDRLFGTHRRRDEAHAEPAAVPETLSLVEPAVSLEARQPASRMSSAAAASAE